MSNMYSIWKLAKSNNFVVSNCLWFNGHKTFDAINRLWHEMYGKLDHPVETKHLSC